jgi:hydroxymethylpyrimidine pyrophosphatase-like HAD family hydrolase
MNFQAVMLDFDGTITEPGVYEPLPDMASALFEASQKVPVSFCTGRQLESFLDHGLNFILAAMPRQKHLPFLRNLHLIAENGSIGYYFDPNKEEFVEFFRVKWPTHFIDRDFLMKELEREIAEFGDLYYNAHRVIIVMRTNLHRDPNRTFEAVSALSDKIYDCSRDYMMRVDPNYSQYLNIGNSGIGVLLCPSNGDKDNGIKMFAQYLSDTQGTQFASDEAREILVIGDRPKPCGNDHMFLKGLYGTPYTVGNIVEGAEYPYIVEKDGQRLVHTEGTKFLLSSLL